MTLPTLAQPDDATLSPRTRSRGWWAAAALLAAAAVVAAIVLENTAGRPSASPPTTPASSSPTATAQAQLVGDAPRIPYIVGETLYLGNKAQRGTFMEVQSGGRSVIAFRPYGAGAIPVIFRDDRRVAVLRNAVGGSRLSPDGTMFAWFEVSGGTDHLVLRDLTSGTDVGHVSADARAVNPDFYGKLVPYSVADDGTVVFTTNARTYFSWHPGGTPVQVRAPHVRKAPPGFSPDASFVTLNETGTWAVWVTDRFGHNPESFAANGVTDGATFEKRGDPSSLFTVSFPDGGSAYKVMWESDTDVLLDYLIDGQGSWDHYQRCSVVTRRCEYAPTPSGH